MSRWSAHGRARLSEGPAVAFEVVRLVSPVAMLVNVGHDRRAAGPGPGAVGLHVIDEHPGHMPECNVGGAGGNPHGAPELAEHQRAVSPRELAPPALRIPVMA